MTLLRDYPIVRLLLSQSAISVFTFRPGGSALESANPQAITGFFRLKTSGSPYFCKFSCSFQQNQGVLIAVYRSFAPVGPSTRRIRQVAHFKEQIGSFFVTTTYCWYLKF